MNIGAGKVRYPSSNHIQVKFTGYCMIWQSASFVFRSWYWRKIAESSYALLHHRRTSLSWLTVTVSRDIFRILCSRRSGIYLCEIVHLNKGDQITVRYILLLKDFRGTTCFGYGWLNPAEAQIYYSILFIRKTFRQAAQVFTWTVLSETIQPWTHDLYS